MKHLTRGFGLFLVFLLLAGSVGIPSVGAEEPGQRVTILFTHDLHDHLLPMPREQGGVIGQMGGYARLQTAISAERQKDPALLLLDAGDYSMGTLFQTIYASTAPELRLLGQMGYDVTTIGNHEFDFLDGGLAASLNAAKASGDRLPRVVAANIAFPTAGDGPPGAALAALQTAMDAYGVQEYAVLERSGLRIGIFGLVGKEAASNAPMTEVVFTDPLEAAGRVVEVLRQEEKVDLVICLSHSGTDPVSAKSEDEVLAGKVPGIDVIISGHTHSRLDQPIEVGETVIGSVGEYGAYLGILTIRNTAGVWQRESYRLQPIDEHLPPEPVLQQRIEQYQQLVQETYLQDLGLDFAAPLAYSPYSFVPASQIGVRHAEDPLGNLISDAYRFAVQKAEGDDYEPVAVAIVPSGTIRGSFVPGEITVSDAFAVSPLGMGADGESGFPLLSVYLTGKELRAACEVDASVTPLMRSAQLYMSGITYTFNPNRLIFNKVTAAALLLPDGRREEIEDDRLYRVVAGLYSAQMLAVVKDKSFGLLSIVPKTADGRPISDFTTQIILDRASGGEVKEWAALAEYLRSFEPVGGIPRVPEYYSQTRGRKIVDNRRDILARLSQPNGIALAVYGIVGGVAAGAVLLTRLLLRRRRRISG